MKYLLFTVLFFAQACNKNSYPTFDYNKTSNPWIDAFKDKVFFSALVEAYKTDTTIFKLIRKKDALNPYDGIKGEASEVAQKIGIDLIKNMPAPAMCESCEAEMNYYMATALHFYKSKELDNIARENYAVALKKDKKSGLINK
ncbi:MAG TPA: hypothetical protein VFM99_06625 [Chitinophagales bacterium]|nr:hypothetical protein [Chitinophagales bacterium]